MARGISRLLNQQSPPCEFIRRSAKSALVRDGSPTEAALLRLLLWVKREPLSLHPLNQFLDPIKQWLIGDARRYVLVMFDLAVEFGALLTHCNSVFARSGSQHWLLVLDDGEAAGLFYKFKLGHL